MSDPGNVAHQDKANDTGKTTPPPPNGQVPSPIKHVEKQPQAKQADHYLRPLAKLNLEGDEKCMIGKSMADPSLVDNFIPKGKAAFRPVDIPADGTIAIPGSSTILSDNPNLVRPTPEPSKAPHDHKKVEAKESDPKQKKSRSVEDSKEKIAPKKSPNVVEVHKQESESKGKAKGDHEHKKKPRSAEPKDKPSPKKKSADNRKSNKNQHGSSKEKGTEEVSPPVVGKKTSNSKTNTDKGSQTKVGHTKTGDHSHKSHEKIKTIVPGDHGKSKTKSDGKNKPKSADK